MQLDKLIRKIIPLAIALTAATGAAAGFDQALAIQISALPDAGWSSFSPRDEIAPRCGIDPTGGRAGAAALRIDSDGHAAAFGGWRRRVDGLTGGRTYRFSAWYRTANVANERRSVIARLEWFDDQGRAVHPPDYALDIRHEGAWTEVAYVTPVPEQTRRVEIRLALGFTPGAVWWDDIRLTVETNAPNRRVRAMTIFHRPRETKSPSESVEQFCRIAEAAATNHPDLVCLPEGITVVGTGKSYPEVSEPIPGPTTARLGALAKKLNCYVVAGIYERSGRIVFNTAILLGRDGQLVGTYRKTHLPREEWEAGVTPGDSYPVFETDFGKLGLLICWDVQFPEAARALAAKGAEVIALPIWGGSETLAKARAIENSVFLVSSSYDMRTFIVDPTGAVLAEATKENPVAAAEMALDRKFLQPWIGDMKTRTWKEWRPDLLRDR